MQYRIIDSDAHTVEPPDMWERYLPAKYRADGPRVVKDPRGGDAWEFGRGVPARPIGMVATPGQRYEDMHWFGTSYETMRRGCFEGKARLEDMDQDGVDAEFLYPWPSMVGFFLAHPDDGLHKAGIEGYNKWVLSEFAAADPKRLFPMFQMPNLGIDASVTYLKEAKKAGYLGINLSSYPSGGAKLSPADDPLWAEAEGLDMPVNLHIPGISAPTRAAAAAAGIPMVEAIPNPAGLLGGTVGAQGATMINLITSGMFDRFPKLKMVAVETQAGWIPSALEFWDDRFWRNKTMAGSTLELLPSEYYYRNWAVTFIIDNYAVKNRHDVGLKNLMWSSDYPHHGNDWPYSKRVIDQMTFGVPKDERDLIVCGNAMRIYGLKND